MKSRTVSVEVRNRIVERDGEQCQVCKSFDGPWEVDHKLPVSRGGTHADENLWLLCAIWNQAKRDMTVEEFLDLVIPIGGVPVTSGPYKGEFIAIQTLR